MPDAVKLEKCPFCGGPLESEVMAEGLHAEGWCQACGWSMEEWSGGLSKLHARMNRRTPSTTASTEGEKENAAMQKISGTWKKLRRKLKCLFNGHFWLRTHYPAIKGYRGQRGHFMVEGLSCRCGATAIAHWEVENLHPEIIKRYKIRVKE